jgi:DNA repair exonuclease SbcCD ATPase subunit
MDIGYKLTTDSSEFMGAFARAERAVQDLAEDTKALEGTTRNMFTAPTKSLDEYNKKVTQSAGSFSKMNEEVKKVNKSVNESFNAYKNAEGTINRLVAREKALTDARNRSNNPKAIERYNTLIKQNQNEIQKLTGKTQQLTSETNKAGSAFTNIQTAIAAAFSIGAVTNFVDKILSTRAEFQKFEAVLTNTLGSKSLAQSALTMIQDVASKTPFSVQELTASFVKLANQGFQPTAAEITKLGDLAASQGKSFDQLAEGIIDAQTGEFERLKEFGIRAAKEGNNVKFTFKGVETQVQNNSKAIQQYILGLGDLQGVAGGMAAISDTLGGKISNLGDNFDAFFNNLGEISEGVFAGVLDEINNFIGAANDAQKLILSLQRDLKGTTGELTFFDKLSGAEAALLPLKTTIDAITKFGAEAKKTTDFAPAYNALKLQIQLINQQFKSGKIDVEEYNRQILLTAKAQQTLDEQRKALAEKDRKSTEADEAAKLKALKESADKTKKLREDLAKELIDLEKRAAKAAIELIDENSEEKVKKQKDLNLKEIDELRKTIIEKGKLLRADFTLTKEQEEQLFVIRQQIENDANKKILELKKKQADKEFEIAKKGISNEVELLKLRADLQTARINAEEVPEGSSKLQQLNFEKVKQEALLKIKLDSAIASLDIKEKQLEAEAQAEINAAPEQAAAIKERLALQKDILFQETQNTVSQINNEISKLWDGSKKFDLAELLGLTKEQFDQVKASLRTFINETAEAFSSIFDLQQAQLDRELNVNQQKIDASKELIDQKNSEVDELESKLDREKSLLDQGLANNTDAINRQIAIRNEEIEAEKARQQQLLEEEKRINAEKQRIAKQQAIVDTIAQGSNLITASTDIYKSLAPLGPVGIGLAIGTITAMITSFLTAKARIFSSVNDGGFAEGGYTGDGGKYDEAGVVHKGEYVMTKEKTNKNWDLLHGLHTNNIAMMEAGIRDLIRDKGISIASDIGNDLSHSKNELRTAEMRAFLTTDNSGLESRIETLDKRLLELIKANENKHIILPDGTQVIKKGSLTKTIRPKK